MNVELQNSLIDLFLETGRAHHIAFAATGGADHLREPIGQALGTSFTGERLSPGMEVSATVAATN